MRYFVPLLVLGALLAATGAVRLFVAHDTADLVKAHFDEQAGASADAIRNLLGYYQDELQQVQTLAEINPPQSREEFSSLFKAVPGSTQYPGVAAIVLAQKVSLGDLPAFVARMRNEYPDFAVSPSGARPEYYILVYSEPYQGNEQVIGVDIAAHDGRRIAAMNARDSGSIAASTRVELLTDAPGERTGIVLFAPLYRTGMPLSTVAERRRAVTGTINMALSTDVLFRSALAANSAIDLDVYDGTTTARSSLLFDYDHSVLNGSSTLAMSAPSLSGSPLQETRQLAVGDRTWTVVFRALPTFEGSVLSVYGRLAPSIVLALGTVLSFLISFLVYVIMSARERALVLADEATANYRRSNKELERKTAELSETTRRVQEQNKALTETRTAILNVLDDLNAEKERTEEERAKDEAILESIGEGLVVVDTQGTIIVMNNMFEKMLGVRKDTILGKSYTAAFILADEHGVPLAEEKRPLSRILTSGTAVAETLQLIKNDGSLLPVRITVTPVFAGSKLIGGVDIIHDLSKEREIERLRADFLALASHQLRTPLSGTKWLIETMLAGVIGTFTKKQKEYLRNIYLTNERMIRLVYDMLSVLRLESNDAAVETKTISARELFDDILVTSRTAAQSKKMRLQSSLSQGEEVKLTTDPVILRSILENFVSNAINYSPERSTAVLAARSEGKDIVFSVADTGIGIPPDERRKIFERFYRASNARAQKPDGTGLGLYIAKVLSQKIGATITFDSELGKGTTFYLRIPKSR